MALAPMIVFNRAAFIAVPIPFAIVFEHTCPTAGAMNLISRIRVMDSGKAPQEKIINNPRLVFLGVGFSRKFLAVQFTYIGLPDNHIVIRESSNTICARKISTGIS